MTRLQSGSLAFLASLNSHERARFAGVCMDTVILSEWLVFEMLATMTPENRTLFLQLANETSQTLSKD